MAVWWFRGLEFEGLGLFKGLGGVSGFGVTV